MAKENLTQNSDRVKKFQACVLLLFAPKPDTRHFVPVSSKRLQNFHTGTSSHRSEFVPHVNTSLELLELRIAEARLFLLYSTEIFTDYLLSDIRLLSDPFLLK